MKGIKIKLLNIQKSKIIPIFFIMLVLLSVVSATHMSLSFKNEPKGDIVMSMRLIDYSEDSIGKILVTTGFRRGDARENGYVFLYDHNGDLIWSKEVRDVDSTMSSIRDGATVALPPANEVRPFPRDAYGIDFTGNRSKEILLLTESHFYILDVQGRAQHSLNSFPVSQITWADVSGDGREQALIAGSNSSILSYDGTNYILSTVDTSSVRSITSANIDPKVSQREIITGGDTINIYGYNSSTTDWDLKTSYNAELPIKKVIAINLETGNEYRSGDKKIEIIALSEKYVYCFHAKDDTFDLELLWRYPIKEGSDLIVANIMGDETLEIIAAGERVYAIDKTGTRLWESSLGKYISHIHSSDLTEDGYAEIVAGTITTYRFNKPFGELFFLDGHGNLLTKTNEKFMTEYVIIKDMNHNGILNLVLADYQNFILGHDNIMGKTMADHYFNQGLTAFENENYRDALIYFKMARESYQKDNNTQKVLQADDYIEKCELFLNTGSSFERGMFYFEMGEYQKSILYFEDSRIASLNRRDFDAAVRAENMKEKATRYLEAENYTNEANTLMSEGNYQGAYSLYNNALLIYQRLRDSQKISSTQEYILKLDSYKKASEHFDAGLRHFSAENYQTAKNYFEKASAEFNALGDMQKVSSSQEYIAKSNEFIESSRRMGSFDDMLLYGGVLIGFLLLIVLLLFFILLK